MKGENKIKHEEFREYLSLYGSDINSWPEDIRGDALKLYSSSDEMEKIVADEKEFESLLQLREFEHPEINLATTIINSARSEEQTKSESLWAYIEELFSTFRIPVPVMALSLLLICGITIGYFYGSMPNGNQNEEVALNDFLYYEGDYYE
ncbi:MAG: hypothetical protein GWN11_03955 [Candidatus Dadabacteria bacterium]|nr:hypothetical protein [Nitrosopumilaceae archaeon]NIX15037.1 hypothetical protein [Candidatus Dadabacteria bacterium]